MKVNDVVTVLTSLGTEYVGRMQGMDTNGIKLSNPLLVTTSEQGIGFASGIAMTGNAHPKSVLINLTQIVFITETNPVVEKAWVESTSGLVT